MVVASLLVAMSLAWLSASVASPNHGAALAPAGGSSLAPTSTAAVLPATGSSPTLGVIGTAPVGGSPEFAAYDPVNGRVYVPNWGNNNVSVLNGTAVVATINVGSVPFSATYDPFNEEVYVVNEGSGNVSVINGTTVVASVTVGTTPQFASYSGSSHLVYVSNFGSASVSVISGTTVTATIPVGTEPSRVVVGASSGGGGGGWNPNPSAGSIVLYVPNSGSDNVTVIGGVSGTSILATVPVGHAPQFGTWDPNNVWLYVPNLNSNNVSILTSTSPYRVLATVNVGTAPYSASFVASSGQVLVVNSGSGNITVLGGALAETVVATIPVGSTPEFIAQDGAPVNELLVPNTGSGDVSVISGTHVVASIPAGSSPIYGTVDPANGDVYIQNFASSNVTILGPSFPVTFKEHGLLSGTAWHVAAGTPPATESNTTTSTGGAILFHAAPGTLAFSIAPPAGFGVARVTGTGVPNQTSDLIAGPSVLTVLFGPLEKVFFNETVVGFELYAGAGWTVALTAAAPHGGPAPQNASTHGSSLNFTAPAGAAYKFAITGPGAEYKVLPPRGGLHVPAHTSTKIVKFKLLTAVVVFHETGLPARTAWNVTISSGSSPALTYPLVTNGTTTAITLHLPAGSYTWTVASAGHTPATGSGTLTVVVPSAATTVQTGPWT